MASDKCDEIRVRVTIDADMPELLQRLVISSRQSREAVHLMRLGLQMEKMLSSSNPMLNPLGESAVGAPVSASSSGESPAGQRLDSGGLELDHGTPHGADFAALTGLDAAYFDAPPSAGMNFN